MSSNPKRNEVIEEFIEISKSEPSLWRTKSKLYHDRSKRDVVYAKLLTKLKELEPDAVKDTVVKKINNMRSNVRKERKKYEASVRSGIAPDFVYKPTFWYYELFDFLKDQDTSTTLTSNMDNLEESENGEEIIEEIQQTEPDQNINEALVNGNDSLITETFFKPQTAATESLNEHRPLTNARPGINNKKKNDELASEVVVSVRDHFKKPQGQEDRYDLMRKTVVMRVRGLEKRQCMIAASIISSPEYRDGLFFNSVHNTTTGKPMMIYTPLYNTTTNNSVKQPTIIRKHIISDEEVPQQINK